MREPPYIALLVLHVELFLPLCQSLKEKRGILKPALQFIRKNWNVAVAETELQDCRNRARLSHAALSGDLETAESAIRRIEDYWEALGEVEVQDIIVERY